MLEDVTVSLPTLATIVIMTATWAGSIAGVYFGLRNRIATGEARMDRFKVDLDAGSSKFAGLDARCSTIEKQQTQHGERIIVVETLLGTMNDKLDSILTEVRNHK